MISFKAYLLERNYAVSTGKKEWGYAASGGLPLSPSMLQAYEKDVTAFHVTDIAGLPNVEKYQGKRKDLATFSRGSEGLAKGIYTVGELLLTLKGKSSFSATVDASTHLDRTGIRWLLPTWKAKKLESLFTAKMLVKVTAVYKDQIPESGVTYFEPIWQRITKMVTAMDGKDKNLFFKYYLDEAKKLITKELLEELIEEIEALNLQKGPFDNDEILLHNYKIIDTKVIMSNRPENVEKLKANAKAAKLDISKYKTISQDDLAKISPIKI